MIAVTWAPEATPQPPEIARSGPSHPEVVEAAVASGVVSVVHFTRTRGLLGALGKGVLRSRADLHADDWVRHVYEPNAANRSRDAEWISYISMSISRINAHMFASSKGWHPGEEWMILEFGPQILGHPGVVFCTTNNAYPVVHRAEGLAGYEQMFARRVPWGKFGSVIARGEQEPHQPTDRQAEVLYPGDLDLAELHTITVGDEETLDTVNAVLSHFPHGAQLVVRPEAFR